MTSSDLSELSGLTDIFPVIPCTDQVPDREKTMIYSSPITDLQEKLVRNGACSLEGHLVPSPVWVTPLISERDIGIRNRVFLRKKYYGYRCNEHKNGSI
jgi:hypothetical protein